jgi:hypothetical protein
MLSVIMLSVIILSVIMLSVIMLSVIMLSVIILSVIRLSVIMLSVLAPFSFLRNREYVTFEKMIVGVQMTKRYENKKMDVKSVLSFL